MGIFDLDKYITEGADEENIDAKDAEKMMKDIDKQDPESDEYKNGSAKIEETFYEEGTFMGNAYEQAAILEATEKITKDDLNSPELFKKKFKEQLDEKKDNPKKAGKFVYSIYFAILGNTFYDNFEGNYVSILPVIVPAIKEYCNDKQKARITKDIENTIKKLEDVKNKGKQLNRKQKGWLKDIKAVKL